MTTPRTRYNFFSNSYGYIYPPSAPNFPNPFTVNMQPGGYVIMGNPLPPNLNNADETGQLIEWSISDGVHTYDRSTSYRSHLYVSTDAAGQITAYTVAFTLMNNTFQISLSSASAHPFAVFGISNNVRAELARVEINSFTRIN